MSEEIMRQNLLVLAQRYAEGRATARGRPAALTTVSKKIHGNQKFLEKFLDGSVSTTIRMYFAMVEKLRKDWPEGVKWPETRPVPRLNRIPYRPATNQPPRGNNGRFLGKKVHKGSRAPIG